MDQVKQIKPAIVVVDSFKAFDDLAKSHRGAPQVRLRARGQPDGVGDHHLSPRRICGSTISETTRSSRSSTVSIMVTQREQSGEYQRFMQVVKMRGIAHSREEHTFVITRAGSRCSRRA